METPKFILLHLAANNSAVSINVSTISTVIKDVPAGNDDNCTETCIYFQDNMGVKRIFVNESVERVYSMIMGINPAEPKEKEKEKTSKKEPK